MRYCGRKQRVGRHRICYFIVCASSVDNEEDANNRRKRILNIVKKGGSDVGKV